MKSPNRENGFETFPVTVKRKYFSTLERLGLAQACSTSKLSSSASQHPSPFKAPETPTRPPFNRSKTSSYLRPSARRCKKAPTNQNLSTVDAQWFLSLPDKVQRRQFTLDEQRMLAGHCEEVFLDTTEATLYRLGRQSNQSVPSLRPSSSSTASTGSFYFKAEQDPTDSAIDMDDAMLENFRWMDGHDHLDLSLDDYHSHVVKATSTKLFSDRRPSFHRNHLPYTMPLHGTSSASPSKASATRTPTPISRTSLQKSHQRQISQSSTTFLPIHHNRPSADATAARHYQDPEARLKLRVYLASPSKFDEAIEFGFPPLPAEKAHTRPSLSNHRYATAPANPETFFDDDSPSLLNALDGPSDDDDEGSSSLPDLEPITPSSTVFPNTHRLPSSKHASSEYTHRLPSSKCTSTTDLQSSLKPKLRHLSPTEPPCSREMTLRMTLTRPDLRIEEVVGSKGAGGESDPLALEELPPARNGGTIWDTVPRESGWRRVWRKVSRRNISAE